MQIDEHLQALPGEPLGVVFRNLVFVTNPLEHVPGLAVVQNNIKELLIFEEPMHFTDIRVLQLPHRVYFVYQRSQVFIGFQHFLNLDLLYCELFVSGDFICQIYFSIVPTAKEFVNGIGTVDVLLDAPASQYINHIFQLSLALPVPYILYISNCY